MRAKEVLSNDEFKEYYNRWDQFNGKKELENKFNVHSSKPVISKIFIYMDKPLIIAKAKIFQKKLREFDPYFVTNRYAGPFWHIQHYLMVIEQMYHATTNLVKDNSKYAVKDTFEDIKMRMPLYWANNNGHVSVELILDENEKIPKKFLLSENACFNFYNNKDLLVTSIYFKTYVDNRAYIKDLHILNNGSDQEIKSKALEDLIRKIEMQDVRQNQWSIDERKSLNVKKDELINDLVSGDLLEEKLHDFFSLWDIPIKNQTYLKNIS